MGMRTRYAQKGSGGTSHVPLYRHEWKKEGTVNVHFFMAAFTFTMISGGMGSILWAVFACSAIFLISSASVGADVSKVQFFPKHLNDGIIHTVDSFNYDYLFIFILSIFLHFTCKR